MIFRKILWLIRNEAVVAIQVSDNFSRIAIVEVLEYLDGCVGLGVGNGANKVVTILNVDDIAISTTGSLVVIG